MATSNISMSINAAGLSINGQLTRTHDTSVAHDVTLPAGTSGSLSTRTDDDTGVVTAAGHGLSENDVVDVYWSGGLRRGMVVSSVSSDDVTLGTDAGDVGAGDVLPAQGTAVVITQQVEITSSWDGDDAALVLAHSTQRASVDFQDSGSATLLALDLTANEPWFWNGTGTNPLTGNAVASIFASNGSATDAATLKIAAALDGTP